MIGGTKIKERVEIKKFIELIEGYDYKQIECTAHTFFRLSEKQRKIFTCDDLKRILTTETPFLAGIQYNKNYAVFYKHKDKNLKIIIGINSRKINIVTFYFIEEWQIPRI